MTVPNARETPELATAAARVMFPLILTPYGIAALVVLLANSDDAQRATIIL